VQTLGDNVRLQVARERETEAPVTVARQSREALPV